MYFEDLTPYTYLKLFRKAQRQPILNVGWLDAQHSFTLGPIKDGILDRLFEQCGIRMNLTKGYHVCPFCPPPASFVTGLRVTRHGKTLVLGDAEIHVHGDGVIFVAPNLVFHYVEAHGYRPPDAFLAALLHPTLKRM